MRPVKTSKDIKRFGEIAETFSHDCAASFTRTFARLMSRDDCLFGIHREGATEIIIGIIYSRVNDRYKIIHCQSSDPHDLRAAAKAAEILRGHMAETGKAQYAAVTLERQAPSVAAWISAVADALREQGAGVNIIGNLIEVEPCPPQ